MRCPSDPQAQALAIVADFEARGEQLCWRPGRRGMAGLALEKVDRVANKGRWQFWSQGDVKERSVQACVRAGWLDATHEQVLTMSAWGIRGDETCVLRELRFTEDGVIALGLWRERKLNAPPVPLPELTDADRTLLALVAAADRLGCRVVAREDDVRKQARRLVHDGWARRGYTGPGETTLRLTALGQVEAEPNAADGRACDPSA